MHCLEHVSGCICVCVCVYMHMINSEFLVKQSHVVSSAVSSAYRPHFKTHVKAFAEFLFKPEQIVVRKAFSVPLKCAEMMNRFKVHSGPLRRLLLTFLTPINVDLH